MMTQNLDFSPEQEDIIESIREKDGIPGVAAAIVKDGEMVAAGGFGNRNRDANLPMTIHTVSPLCSLTKSFTGVAVMQLVDSGKLSLDEPVVSYLPTFRVADGEASRKMTPRIFLCHKSGMGRTGHQGRCLGNHSRLKTGQISSPSWQKFSCKHPQTSFSLTATKATSPWDTLWKP